MPLKKTQKPGTPGRVAVDGITKARRRNLSIDDETWERLVEMGGVGGVSRLVRDMTRDRWAAFVKNT